jgi:ParB family transcriptional regulator, chromosome partitioning protein
MNNQHFKTIDTFNTEFTAGNIKTAMSQAGASSSDLWKVPVTQIRTLDGHNLRIPGPGREAHVAYLTASILANGFYSDKPLSGYVAQEDGNPVIYLLDGGCRYSAVLEAIKQGAPIETVPVVIKDRSSSMEDLTIALLTSNEGKQFTALEKALGAKRLKGFGKSDVEIAAVLNCTAGYVGQLLTLAGAPLKIRQMVQSGEVAATLALDAMKKHGEGAADVLGKATGRAKEQGKGKASAKHLAAPDASKLHRKHGPALFDIVGRYLDTKPNIPDPFGQELDALFAKTGG